MFRRCRPLRRSSANDKEVTQLSRDCAQRALTQHGMHNIVVCNNEQQLATFVFAGLQQRAFCYKLLPLLFGLVFRRHFLELEEREMNVAIILGILC